MKVIGYIDPNWVEKQVALEDEVWWAKRPNPKQPKAVMAKELPAQKWSPATKFVFGSSIIRFAYSMLP